MKVKESENRRAPRHQGKLPVMLKGGRGITRDFSASGIFFETERSFSPGQFIEFAITLEYADPAGPVQMKCRGEIVRAETSGQKIGIAATINSYSLEEIVKKGVSSSRWGAETRADEMDDKMNGDRDLTKRMSLPLLLPAPA